LAGQTPEEAVNAFFGPINEAARCITEQPFWPSGNHPSSQPHSLTFYPEGSAGPLDSKFGKNSILFFLSHLFVVVPTEDKDRGPWKVSTLGYIYAVLDRQGHEIVAFHWNPADAGPPYPHVHISGMVEPLNIGEKFDRVPLGDLHIPTDRLALEAVIRFLITEFGVPPRKTERPWSTVLDEGEAVFRAWRTRSG
jgi:hypothetical protein